MSGNYSFFVFLVCAILIPYSCSKKNNYQYFYCDYIGQNQNDYQSIRQIIKRNQRSDKIGYADSLAKEIVSLSLPYRDFELIGADSNNVKVAKAFIDENGIRYIIYNENILKKINLNNSNAHAANLGVIAHEIGHLLYGHKESNHENERIADQYAGWVLKKLGVNEDVVIKGLNDNIRGKAIYGSKTHPELSKRVDYTKFGWRQAEIDSKYKISKCCDTSFYSSFEVEGIYFNRELNEGKSSLVDFTILTYDIDGNVIEKFDKQIRYNLKIKPTNGEQQIIFNNLEFVITNRKFNHIQFNICECIEPCGDINLTRRCLSTSKLIKNITESFTIPFDDYGYMKLKFYK